MLLVLSLGGACGGSDDDPADKIAEGKSLFAASCAACHGPDGTGGTGPTLNAKEHLTVADDQQLSNKISVGIVGTQMRAWSKEFGGTFSDGQIESVVAYLRSLEPNAPSVPNWQRPKTTASTTSSTTP